MKTVIFGLMMVALVCLVTVSAEAGACCKEKTCCVVKERCCTPAPVCCCAPAVAVSCSCEKCERVKVRVRTIRCLNPVTCCVEKVKVCVEKARKVRCRPCCVETTPTLSPVPTPIAS